MAHRTQPFYEQRLGIIWMMLLSSGAAALVTRLLKQTARFDLIIRNVTSPHLFRFTLSLRPSFCPPPIQMSQIASAVLFPALLYVFGVASSRVFNMALSIRQIIAPFPGYLFFAIFPVNLSAVFQHPVAVRMIIGRVRLIDTQPALSAAFRIERLDGLVDSACRTSHATCYQRGVLL